MPSPPTVTLQFVPAWESPRDGANDVAIIAQNQRQAILGAALFFFFISKERNVSLLAALSHLFFFLTLLICSFIYFIYLVEDSLSRLFLFHSSYRCISTSCLMSYQCYGWVLLLCENIIHVWNRRDGSSARSLRKHLQNAVILFMSPTSVASNAALCDVQRQSRIRACIYFQSLISGTWTQSSLTPLIWRKNLGTAAKSVNVLDCRIARIVLTHRVRTARRQRFHKICLSVF